MDKQALKQHMLNMEFQHIRMAEREYHLFLSDANMETEEMSDPDDLSHHVQSTDTAAAMSEQMDEHSQHVQILQHLDFGPTDTVQPGAVVKINGKYLVVAVADQRFSFDGKSFLGISTQAPIYACLHGKKQGDTCQLNGNNFKIEEVY